MSPNLIEKKKKPCPHLKIVFRKGKEQEIDLYEAELIYAKKLDEIMKYNAFDLHLSSLNTINEYVKKVLKNSNSSQAKDIIEILDNNLDLIMRVGDKLGFSSIFNEAHAKLS